MPALPPVENVIRCAVNATIAGQPFVNVFHLHYNKTANAPATQAEVTTTATNVRNAYKLQILPQLSSTFLLGSLVAQDLTSATSPQATVAGSDAGGASGTAYPNNVAMCVSW